MPTLLQLRTRLRRMTDTENDTHLADAELNIILNAAGKRTWDKMIESMDGDELSKSVTFNTIAGTQEYNLRASTYVTSNDFYKLNRVYVNEGNGQYRPIPRIDAVEVQTFRPPQSVVPIKLWYIPKFTELSGDTDDLETLNPCDMNGWDDYLLNIAAVEVKRKQQEDYGAFERTAGEIAERMATMGQTDWSEPVRVKRKRHRLNRTWYPYNNQITAYLYRAGKLELLYSYPWVP